MNWDQLTREVKFRADRSSGSGGQHVNKVATKVTLSFYPAISLAFTDEEKERVLKNLKEKLSKEGALIVSEQNNRSQFLNRKFAFQKLSLLIEDALAPPLPKRKKVKLKVNKVARRKSKELHSKKKANRRKIQIDEQ